MNKVIFFHTERGATAGRMLHVTSANLVDFYIKLSRSFHESIIYLPKIRNVSSANVLLDVPEKLHVEALPYPDGCDSAIFKIYMLLLFIRSLLKSEHLSDINEADVSISAGLEFGGTVFGFIRSVICKKRHAFIIRGNRLLTIKKSSRLWINKIFALMRVYSYERVIVYLIKNRDVQVWFQGDENCEAYKKMLGNKYEDKLFILNAVLRDLPLISDADQNNKTVDLLYIGRITMEKGIKDLLNAISILHSQGLSPKTVIVGVGPYLNDAKQLATNLNIDHLVSFAGYVSDSSEICSYFQTSKLFVLPSHTEGLPRSMLESMAACLPVIVTGVGGIPYLIENNVNGYLVKPEDPVMLSDKIREALNASDDELSMIIYRAKSDAMRFTFSERANYFLSNILND